MRSPDASHLRRIRVIDGSMSEPACAAPRHAETMTTIVAASLTASLLEIPWSDRIRLMPPPATPVTLEQACHLLLNQSRATNDVRGSVRLAAGLSLDIEQAVLVTSSARLPIGNGELRLLRYLLERPRQWCSIGKICAEAFLRTDFAAHQLVWKYASVLRKKLSTEREILQNSRRLGYRIVTDSGAG